MSRVPIILLSVLSGPDQGQEKRFNQYCVRLGRDYRNDFVLSDRFVSGRHGKLVWESGSLVYYDLQSRHGTAVSTSLMEKGQSVEKSVRLQDQYKVSRHEVAHGAQMLLGSTLLQLQLEKRETDTLEEQAAIRSQNDELSLQPFSVGELTANPEGPDDELIADYPMQNYHPAPLKTGTFRGSFMPTEDFLPAPETAAPPPRSQSSTLFYQNAFDPSYDYLSSSSSAERPSIPHSEFSNPSEEHVASSNYNDRTYRENTGLHVPAPGPQPKVPTASLLTSSVGTFSSEPGGALSKQIQHGLNDYSDVDAEHLWVGTGSYSAWGQTQTSLPPFDQDKISIDPFPDEDISKYATAEAYGAGFEQRLDKTDPRMEMLFQLTGKLNRSNHIDDILSLIVEATFDSLKAAQFFAICQLNEEGEFVPYMSRNPGGDSPQDEKVTLSQSLLKEVAEKKEAVLFVRDRTTQLSQSIIDAEIWSCLCAPLVGQSTLLGVMLIDTRKKGALFTPQDLNLFSVLASSAAFALERAQLTGEIVRMFEGFVEASVTAIEARDPTTAGHSQRVATYTIALAESVNDIHAGELSSLVFSREELVELRYAALLHDIGKVGVREDVLNKASRLTDDTMAVIHQRFETFKARLTQHRYEELFQRLQKEKRPPKDDELLHIRVEQETFSQELADVFRWIEQTRRVEYINEEAMDRLEQLSERHVTLGDGVCLPLLLPQEVDNLRIRRGTLNENEWENMRSHAALSESYLERIPWSSDLQRIPCIAGAHHEKVDGSGYPRGLKGNEVLPQMRILTIADIFDALTAWDRPYRKAASIDKAIFILNEESSAGKLDKRLVEAFIDRVIPKLSLPQQDSATAPPSSTGEYSIFMPKR